MSTLQDDDDIITEGLKGIESEEDITFKHIYLPYTQWRIKEIFLEMGIELRPYYNWYKAMRYRSCQSYVLTDMQTNAVIGCERGYTFEELRYILAKNDFPLHSDKPKTPGQKRRARCDNFLNIVAQLDNPTDEK